MYDNRVHSVPDRIVSISQPYIRPIVRGKAAAPVEFGAKLDLSMADGEPVLDDVFVRVDGGNGHLVALGDIFNSGHRCTVHRHSGAFGNGMQGNHNIILGVDLDCKRHTESPYYDKNR